MSADGGRRESAGEVARRLYEAGGAGAFWDGIGPKVARAVVNHATTFFVFENTLAFYGSE